MSEATSFLPYCRQSIDAEDVAAVAETASSPFLTTGPKIGEFEIAFGAATGASFATACSTGTAALHLSAQALSLGPGDVAIVPSITFIATANAVRFTGAEVKFADVDADTGLMSVDHAREALDNIHDGRPAAIFPVYLNGQCEDPVRLESFARTYGLKIVADASHALGTKHTTGIVGDGKYADCTCFSFHPAKMITCGEGGAVTTRNDDLQERLQQLRSHGTQRSPEKFHNTKLAFAADGSPNPWYYEQDELAYNYRITDLQCALGLSQLRKLEGFVRRRQELVTHYDQLVADLSPAVTSVGRVSELCTGWHLYVVLINFDALKIDRGELMSQLAAHDIGTQVHYIPLHKQPYYQKRYGTGTLSGAESYYKRCLSLPLFPSMLDQDVERVVGTLHDIILANQA